MEEDFEDALRRASAALRVAMERALAPLAITPAQFAVLRIVVAKPGVSGAEAARLERLTAPTLSVIVANLERKGALTRQPHPSHARVQCLTPTAAGRELEAKARAATSSLRARVAGPGSAERRRLLLDWLGDVSQIEV